MRITPGTTMAQTFAGRLSLVVGAALMLSPALLSSASAQMLGYASTSPAPFPSDSIMVEPAQRLQALRQGPFASVTKRRMADVVR